MFVLVHVRMQVDLILKNDLNCRWHVFLWEQLADSVSVSVS